MRNVKIVEKIENPFYNSNMLIKFKSSRIFYRGLSEKENLKYMNNFYTFMKRNYFNMPYKTFSAYCKNLFVDYELYIKPILKEIEKTLNVLNFDTRLSDSGYKRQVVKLIDKHPRKINIVRSDLNKCIKSELFKIKFNGMTETLVLELLNYNYIYLFDSISSNSVLFNTLSTNKFIGYNTFENLIYLLSNIYIDLKIYAYEYDNYKIADFDEVLIVYFPNKNNGKFCDIMNYFKGRYDCDNDYIRYDNRVDNGYKVKIPIKRFSKILYEFLTKTRGIIKIEFCYTISVASESYSKKDEKYPHIKIKYCY